MDFKIKMKKSQLFSCFFVAICLLLFANANGQSHWFLPSRTSSKTFSLKDTTFTDSSYYHTSQINFINDSGEIAPQSYINLDSVATFMKKNSQLVVQVFAHAFQKKLFIEKENKIRNYLLAKGIDPVRLLIDIAQIRYNYHVRPLLIHADGKPHPINYVAFTILRTDSSFAPKGTFNWTDKAFTVGTKRRIEVRFCLDKACIEDSNPALDTTAKFIKANPFLKIGIYNHTDQQGSPQHNIPLSIVRARSITNYLRFKDGIDSARLVPKGFGFTQLIIPTSVIMKEKDKHKRDSLYQINRRTEIVILDNAYKKETK